jgi:3-oxoacyl-[acyl-carrier-protein] synthase II
MLARKVYIIDYEMISPIAVGAEKVMDSINSNYSADSAVKRIDISALPFKNAAEVCDDLSGYYSEESDAIKESCAYDRKLELIVACYGLCKQRLTNLISLLDSKRTGVIIGVGSDVPQLELFEEEIIEYLRQELNPITELYSKVNNNGTKLNLMNNAYDIYSIYLAKKFNAGAFQKTILTACVSSTQAIGEAREAIINDKVDVVIAGGTDSLLNMLAMISFGKLGVISETTENASCRPFDVGRNGTLAGECAGFVILASEEFVIKNNLKPVAQLVGYGNTLDGYKITAPDPKGDSMTEAIAKAIHQAGINPKEVDYINAHGTGTKHNDQLELNCIHRALGDIAKKIPISSTKDRHGHAIAAAGIQELCVLLELMKHERIPGNLNLLSPCEPSFNLVRENRDSKINYAITNNFAFGGINSVLVVKNERT